MQWDCGAEQGFNACGEKDRFFDERVLGGIMRTAMELRGKRGEMGGNTWWWLIRRFGKRYSHLQSVVRDGGGRERVQAIIDRR